MYLTKRSYLPEIVIVDITYLKKPRKRICLQLTRLKYNIYDFIYVI